MKIEEAAFYHVKVSDWPEGERPREKLMQLGPDRLINIHQQGNDGFFHIPIPLSWLLLCRDTRFVCNPQKQVKVRNPDSFG